MLATLLGADTQEPDQEQPTLADARAAADEIAAAVHAHLSALAARRPLAVVLEDLHWADHASVRLLEGLAATLDDERVLLVAAMRPDRHTQAWQLLERAEAGDLDDAAPAVSVVRVKPLDAEGSATLFDELLRVEGMPAATRERILAKAEGNPFYLEEVLRSLIDSGHVVFEDGRWHARREITEVAIPDTLIGVLGARIDRLPEREREVAQTASVIGREFATRLLRAVMRPTSEEEAPDIEPQLGSLTVEGLLSQTRRARFADYRFKHEFTRDTAYERLLLKRRRELHARVAEELETLFGARREVAKDLAHHYLLGERWLEAARWSLQAARSAKRLYALPEALEAAETARAALDRLRGAPGSPGAPGRDAEKRLRAEVAAELVNLGLLARQHEDPALRPALLQRASEAVELARALGDRRLLVTSLVDLGNVHVLSGFPGVGFEWLLQAHDLALELGDDRMFLYPFWVATEILLDDAPAAAVKQFGAVIELARKVGNKPIEAHALGTLTAALARLGDFAAAARTAGQALEAAEESGSIIKRADVNMLVGSAFLEMGRLEPGLELVQRGTDLALSVNGLECACNGLHLLGVGHLAERQLSAAEEDLKRSLATGEGTSMEALLHNVRATLASARFLGGELTAVEDIEREIANAEALRDGYGAAVARLALAEAHLSLAAPERAVPPARQALEWFRRRHMEPYVIRSLRLLAAAAAAQGDEAGRAALEREADELTQALPLPPDAGPLADAARGERRPPDGRASPGGSGG